MKTTSIRELRHETSRVLEWVAQGESVEVRRRNRPVAVLSPVPAATDVSRPDFEARLRATYGDTVLREPGTDLVAEGRGDR